MSETNPIPKDLKNIPDSLLKSKELQKAGITLWHQIQSYGFWVLIILAIGFYFGHIYTAGEMEKEKKKMTILGNFLIETTDAAGKPVTKAYDVKERLP